MDMPPGDKHVWENQLPPLMVRYQRGEPEAAEELMRMVAGLLMRFLAGPGQSKSDTEDLFQECWMRIHKSRHTYRPSEPVLPWVFAIARHTKLDGYRRRRRRDNREVLVSNPPETFSPSPLAPTNAGEEITRLLAKLPESQREVILMLKVAGMSLEEVARATSSTVGSIKQKAHRAYETLRGALEKGRG